MNEAMPKEDFFLNGLVFLPEFITEFFTLPRIIFSKGDLLKKYETYAN